MSIATDVSRIKGNITAALTAIADKGVTVPDGSTSDALAELIASINDVPVYDGPYEAIPKVEAQTLPTAKKLMTDDVTVHGVPFYEVSNDQGGNTVYIAKELI